MKVQVIQPSAQFKRRMRSPQHPFNLMIKPWQIQPSYIVPVLPGETLKNALVSMRCVSDPLKDKLMGWWLEHYVFYVKHTDLDIGDDLIEMHLDATKDMSGLTAAANIKHFHAGGIDYVGKCLDAVVRWYFRDEDEVEPTAIDGMKPAKINHDGWWESAKLESEAPTADHLLPGDEPQIDPLAPAGYADEYAQWQHMIAAGMTDATFEDYLRSFGVKVRKDAMNDEEAKRPELLRYIQKFTYPTNTVEPTTGVPSSAAVWSESARLDKDRFFKEPGFIVGYTVCRPKVLLSNIVGSMTSYMDRFDNWLPAMLQDMPFTSLLEFATASGPAPQAYGEDYWLDLRDLFIYGEQFRNHDASVQGNAIALPDTSLNVDYGTTAMANAFFSGEANFFRIDGVFMPSIAGKAGRDTT